jgi:hypothetical protein
MSGGQPRLVADSQMVPGAGFEPARPFRPADFKGALLPRSDKRLRELVRQRDHDLAAFLREIWRRRRTTNPRYRRERARDSLSPSDTCNESYYPSYYGGGRAGA